MARKNVLDYKSVLALLESGGSMDANRCVTLGAVQGAFVELTDKNRHETIQRHIDYMVGKRLLIKKGETVYLIADNWKGIIEGMLKNVNNQ